MFEVRTFGGVAVLHEGAPIDIGGPNQRRLLAALLISPNRRARSDVLIERIWGDDQPGEPLAALRTNVSRMRRTLRSNDTEDDLIRTVGEGYELGSDHLSIDVDEFQALATSVRHDADASDDQLQRCGRALACSSGRPFGELADEYWLRADVERLVEMRLAVWESRLEALITQGRESEALADLALLIADHPLREHFRVLEATALHRVGRTGEALRSVSRYRTLLIAELGVEPGSALQDLEQRVLSQSLEPPPVSAIDRVRGYELLEQVGEGAYSVVWRARQPVLQREVAIKQIRASLANDADFIRQFEAEAQMVASLEHPHIVPLFDYWREPDSAFLVMRYLRGGSLADVLHDRSIDDDEASTLLVQIGAALAAAHEADVAHGDVHPRNIMLDGEGNFFLSDFGIAQRQNSTLHESPTKPGTHDADLRGLYMTVREAVVDSSPWSDIALLEALTTSVNSATLGESAGELGPLTRNPYKGLHAFQESDSGDFFGRDRVVSLLLDHLSGPHVENRFLALVGPSGSGKSSAVAAGLLPELRRGAIEDSERWFITSMTPGGLPYEELEAALQRVAPASAEGRLALLKDGPTGLARATKQMFGEDEQLLIAIDQFEEVFVSVRDVEVRDAFIETLVQAVRDPKSRVRIVITMRADFWDRPLQYEQFGRLIERSAIHLTPMTADELEDAIVLPAERAGARFEPGLAATIIADVRSDPGAMPLLQYSLRELFRRSRSGLMLRDDYLAMGGVGGALAAQAEGVFEVARKAAGEDSVRRLFSRLVSLGEGTEDTRRRVLLGELDGTGADIAVDAFGEARLVTFDRHPHTREPTIEVAHEALLREWPRLRGWLDSERDEIRVQRHLTNAAREWNQNGRASTELYRGGRLEAAEQLLADRPAELNDVERDFVRAGLEEHRHEEHRRRAEVRRLRRALVVVALTLFVAFASGLAAFVQRGRALSESDRANAARIDAEVARLSADAAQVAESQPRLGLLLASEAYIRDPSVETLGSLQRALIRADSFAGALGVGRDYVDVVFSTDGSAVVARRESALDSFNIETRTLAWSTQLAGSGALAVAPGVVAGAMDQGGVTVLSMENGSVVRKIDSGQVVVLAFDERGEVLYTGDRLGWLRAWDVASGTLRSEVYAHKEDDSDDIPEELRITEADRHIPRDVPFGVRGLALDEDGGRIVTTGGFFVRAWTLDSMEALWEAQVRQPSFVGGDGLVAARPGDVGIAGDRVIAVTRSLAKVFDLRSGEEIGTADPSPRSQTINLSEGLHLAIAAGGDRAYMTDATSFVSSLNVRELTMEQLGSIAVRQRTALVNTPRLAVDPSESLLVVSTADGLRLEWLDGSTLVSDQVPGVVPILGNAPLNRRVSSSADGTRVLIDSFFSEPNLYDVTSGRRVDSFEPGSTVFTWLDWFAPMAWVDQDLTLHLATAGDEFRVTNRIERDSLAWAARSFNGELLAVGAFGTGSSAAVVVYDLASGRVVAELEELNSDAVSPVADVAWSPDDRRLIATSLSGAALVWDTTTWRPVGPQISERGSSPIVAAAFTPDGHHLLTVRDGVLNVRDARTYQPTGILVPVAIGSEESLNESRMSFSGDGKRLLTTFGNAVLIDTESWSAIGDPFPHDASSQLSASVGAQFVATTAGDAVHVWNLDTAEWPDLACWATGGGFNDEDWREYGTEEPPQLECDEWID